MKVRFWTYNNRYQSNTLFMPYIRRSPDKAREILIGAVKKDKIPTITLFPRADGPGSSQDLREFQAALYKFPNVPPNVHDQAWKWSKNSLRTPGACIAGIPITFKLMPAGKENAIEYYTPEPDFKPNLRRTEGDLVPAHPDYFVNAIFSHFGLQGVRMEAEPMPEVAKGTGLGGSNLVHIAAVIFANALSRTNLTLSQVYSLATNWETNFGVKEKDGKQSFGYSITGGQEGLTALQGGIWDNVHMPHLGLFSVYSREIVSPERYAELAKYSFLVNAGKEEGHKRKSTDVNQVFMARFLDRDGFKLHRAKIPAAYQFVEGLRLGDHQEVVNTILEYMGIRFALCPQYIDDNEEIIGKANEINAAFFPVGAGGTRATVWIYGTDPEGIRQIKQYFEDTANPKIGRVVVPFEIEPDGACFENFENNGLEVPTMPEEIEV